MAFWDIAPVKSASRQVTMGPLPATARVENQQAILAAQGLNLGRHFISAPIPQRGAIF